MTHDPLRRFSIQPTSNLTLVCSFHHDLIHKHGWGVALGRRPGVTHWFRPNNQLYEPNRVRPEPDFDELSDIRNRINLISRRANQGRPDLGAFNHRFGGLDPQSSCAPGH